MISLILVRRPPKFLANGPGFKIELFTRDYLPVHIILDEDTLVLRFECLHLKRINTFKINGLMK